MSFIKDPKNPTEGIIIPSGSEVERSKAAVAEVLAKLDMTLREPAETPAQKRDKNMLMANRAAVFAIHEYHDKHPLGTVLPELCKEVHEAYRHELKQFSKDELLELLSMQQTINVMKKFGYFPE